MQVKVQEQTFSGKVLDEILLDIQKEKVTVAELISLRVAHEVSKFNETLSKENKGFAHEVEAKLNTQAHKSSIAQRKLVDIEKETYRALEAFRQNQVFITVDKRQVESLSEEIILAQDSEVSFIQLTPLVGG